MATAQSQRSSSHNFAKLWLVVLLTFAMLASGCTSDGETTDDSTDAAADSDELVATEPLTVSFDEAADWLEALSESEQVDQIRDWAQYGLAAIVGIDGEEAEGFLHDKPGVRDPHLSDVTDARRGVGRYVPNGDTLHLLVPASDPFRSRTIGMLIDDYALASGLYPDQIEIYDYEIESADQSISLQHSEQGSRQEIEATHGIVQQAVADASDLESFLAATEHLSRLWLDDGELFLRGWDWPETDATGLTPEDIAVLQSSYSDSGADEAGVGFSLDPVFGQVDEGEVMATIIPEASDELVYAAYLNWFAERGATDEELFELVDFAEFDLGLSTDKIFELDEALYEKIDSGLYGTEEELAEAATALGIEPDRLKFYALFNFLQGQPIASIARYDGGIEGTEVGMTLFYTDLVAKDWTGGVGTGVPADYGVEGFITNGNLGTNWSYCPEREQSGRLWFGLDSGAAVSSSNSIQFGSVATRLFSRSDAEVGGLGGEEVERSYHFGASLKWWDEHYLQVADHEPQFLRLDQIMRWSAGLTWLADNGVILPVEGFPSPDRSLRFDTWFANRDDLLERSTPFVAPLGTDIPEIVVPRPSETFDLCGEQFFKGGISLPSPRSLRSLAAADDVPAAVRRPTMIAAESDYAATGQFATGIVDDAGNVFNRINTQVAKTPTGTKVEINAFGRQVNSIGQANFYGPGGRARNYSIDIEIGSGRLVSRVDIDDGLLGQLSAETVPSGATIRWRGGVIDSLRQVTTRLQNRFNRRGADGDSIIKVLDDLDNVRAVVGDDSNGSVLTREGHWIRYSDDLIDDQATVILGRPGNGDGGVNRLDMAPLDDGFNLSPPVLTHITKTGRKQVNPGNNIRVGQQREIAASELASFADGRPIHSVILDDGQLAIQGLDPGIRLRVRTAEVDGAVGDVQLVDGSAYAIVGSTTTSTATSIVLVATCQSAAGEECG